jgi:hypothetical protein
MVEEKNEMRGEERRGFDCAFCLLGGRKRRLNAEFAEGAEKRTARVGEEIGCVSIVGAHPSQNPRRMGHPQVQVSGGVTGAREDEEEELACGGGGYRYA